MTDASIETTDTGQIALITLLRLLGIGADSAQITEEYSRRELTLPLHPKMDQLDVEKVVGALGHALA